MEFNLQTPAMIFPAISLLMLAYTNRFLTLAGLVRNLIDEHDSQENALILKQIDNLQIRMSVIRKMQIWGALSFALAIVSMLLQMFSRIPKIYGTVVFIVSLVFLLISLFFLVYELHISINALTFELETIKKEKEH